MKINFYVVFQISLIGTQPNLDVTVRNFIGVAVAGLSIFASHNVFHKVRVYQARGEPVSESAAAEVPNGARPVYTTDFS
mgnify:FL=1|jgi:hypothetical protein